jgi:molecular chaperone DnaJ
MNLDFDPAVDYYKALGVSSTATLDEIKKAYRKLAKQNHPDSTGGDKAKESRFKEISAAYDVLGDVKKRQQYDEIRALGGGRVRTQAGAGGGFPGGMGGMGGFGGGAQGLDLGDLFAQMFQGAGVGGAAAGGRRSVRFERGGDDGWDEGVRNAGRGAPPPDPFEGKTRASDGTWLQVKGGDVSSDVRIPFDHALLGTVAEVATLDGKASVKIPPGTSSGKRLRLRGKGVPGPDGRPGDHYVTVHIDVPDQLDEKGKQLLAELTQHLQAASRRK